VVGVGNILLGDEGIGVHILKELEKKKLPDKVELLDLGVAAFSLLSHIEGKKKIIIIDAVKAEGVPGSVYRLSIEDIHTEERRFFSLHEAGIEQVISFLEVEGEKREIVIIGIEPGEIRWGMELSPPVKKKIPVAVELVLKEIMS